MGGAKGIFSSAALTDVGSVRFENQDRYYTSRDNRILVVADGMGGHKGGSVAAELLVNAFADEVENKVPSYSNRKNIRDWADSVIQNANLEICLTGSANPSLIGMGTTAVVLVFGSGFVHLAHVGDSRMYRLRNRKLERISKDHSVVQELVDRGVIGEEERRSHPKSHIITRYIGERTVRVEHNALKSEGGDVYLLASDGLTDVVPDEDIRDIMLRQRSPENICRKLIEGALARGGPDNITVVVAKRRI